MMTTLGITTGIMTAGIMAIIMTGIITTTAGMTIMRGATITTGTIDATTTAIGRTTTATGTATIGAATMTARSGRRHDDRWQHGDGNGRRDNGRHTGWDPDHHKARLAGQRLARPRLYQPAGPAAWRRE